MRQEDVLLNENTVSAHFFVLRNPRDHVVHVNVHFCSTATRSAEAFYLFWRNECRPAITQQCLRIYWVLLQSPRMAACVRACLRKILEGKINTFLRSEARCAKVPAVMLKGAVYIHRRQQVYIPDHATGKKPLRI